MAPEVYANEQYTHKVDVFSFGVLAYEMLAKKRAYAEKASTGLWTRHDMIWRGMTWHGVVWRSITWLDVA